MQDTVDCISKRAGSSPDACQFKKNGLMSRAHDVWNGAAAGKTADMRGVDIPRLSAFLTWWIDGRTGTGLP